MLEVVPEGEALGLEVAELSKELRVRLQYSAASLEDTVVRKENDLAEMKREALEADVLLVYLIGAMLLQTLFRWRLPMVAFSGQYTPMLALCAFGVERHSRPPAQL
jgi:hypothetical protein